jgi:indolepyruvate ferredoxin oxidoreductase
MALANPHVSLDDKYEVESGRIYLTGTQALVRLPIAQRQRDAAAGINSACFISGYRGSPLGGLDQQLWRAREFLRNNHIHFQPGINEDLAATAIWGSQQVNLFGGARYDGVFAMWYGKGPGVDRSGDALKHANAAGTSRYGGVLAVAGDDHACKSSTLPHQSEYAFIDAMIPVLNPAGVQEILDLGIYGWALSRYCGCWVGFKTIAETVDSSASVDVDPDRIHIVQPQDFELPAEGLAIRWPDKPLEQELRLHRHKLYAALAFARANKFDRIVRDSPKARLGIVAAGKAYLDVCQALEDLGIDDALAAHIGLRVYKVGMTWPLEREGIRGFARGLEEVLVVEEKRAIIENQLKEQLYNWRQDVRPRVIGKFDEAGNWMLPSTGELSPAQVARAIAARIERFHSSDTLHRRLEFLHRKEEALSRSRPPLERTPYFCSGCPHNTSTRVPEGSRALAGIGCHFMALWMDRRTETFTQMGGEGIPWIGQAPFTETGHVFANIGDGTYFHSGVLAVRAAVAAGVNITFKILYNDAVAMTGGQPLDGTLTVAQITQQLYGEGVRRIVVVSDDPHKYPARGAFAQGATIHHRDELDRLQRELRRCEGVSALIYDQVCAAEKRRRRKRGLMPDPPQRVFINELVCEGCGDCSTQSNCLSVIPVETEFGRKRTIDQSSCNKDFSCLKGFCPSFVTVHGGRLRAARAAGTTSSFPLLPDPRVPAPENPYGILVTGVGGTGVVTIGAIIGMAAHLEGKGCTVLDMTGLSQKYGAVTSHVRIARRPEDLHAVRIAAGGAHLLLGCDLIVAASSEALSKLDTAHSQAVINSHESVTAGFVLNPDLAFPEEALRRNIQEATGEGRTGFVDATGIATALMGDSIATNLFMVGHAYQQGLIPVSGEAIERAIELNGVAVDFNKQAFLWGRRAAHDLERVTALARPAHERPGIATELEDIIARRVEFLTDYQDAAYARRYLALVRRAQQAEAERARGYKGLVEALARGYFKLLAYKDEYEVARLYAHADFRRRIAAQLEGDYRIELHLAAPLVGKRDPGTGQRGKRTFGAWVLPVFGVLARLRALRGTPFDPFGHQRERKLERRLIAEYEATVEELLQGLDQDNHALAVQIASLPGHIRGYGHIKEARAAEAKARERELLAAFRTPQPARAAG